MRWIKGYVSKIELPPVFSIFGKYGIYEKIEGNIPLPFEEIRKRTARRATIVYDKDDDDFSVYFGQRKLYTARDIVSLLKIAISNINSDNLTRSFYTPYSELLFEKITMKFPKDLYIDAHGSSHDQVVEVDMINSLLVITSDVDNGNEFFIYHGTPLQNKWVEQRSFMFWCYPAEFLLFLYNFHDILKNKQYEFEKENDIEKILWSLIQSLP